MAIELPVPGKPRLASGRMLVLYDADCGVCSRTAEALRILDRRQRLRLLPLQRATAVLGEAAPAWQDLEAVLHVRGRDGKWWTGGEAILQIAGAVPALRSLAWIGRLPPFAELVNHAYRLIARNRDRLSRLAGAAQCHFQGDPDGP